MVLNEIQNPAALPYLAIPRITESSISNTIPIWFIKKKLYWDSMKWTPAMHHGATAIYLELT